MTGLRRAVEEASTRCRCSPSPGFAASPSWGSLWNGKKSQDFASRTPNYQQDHIGPFSGLTICVTGLSNEARKQVQVATERMGGTYSPDLHQGCTHLVAQGCSGRKYEHALKNGMFVVSLAWFVNSTKLNKRMEESLYDVRRCANDAEPDQFNSAIIVSGNEPPCVPNNSMALVTQSPNGVQIQHDRPILSGMCFYVDADIPNDIHLKVIEAAAKGGAKYLADWYIGCNVTHIVCEKSSVAKYIGFRANLISPIWIFKSVTEHRHQDFVQISMDLARDLGLLLNTPRLLNYSRKEKTNGQEQKKLLTFHHEGELHVQEKKIQGSIEKMSAAKAGVRRRRGALGQPYRTRPNPSTPRYMLEFLCWYVTEPPSTAQLFVGNIVQDTMHAGMHERSLKYVTQRSKQWHPDTVISMRTLDDAEKDEVIYKGPFLTILFPVDRFSEMGPSSRTFFSEKGFTTQLLIENIYNFYQEPLSTQELEIAIHTDSKHADRLRAACAKPENMVAMKKCEFIGSKRSFEGLKRISKADTSQVYELYLSA